MPVKSPTYRDFCQDPPAKRGPRWEASIRLQRNRLADQLDDNPSLKPLLKRHPFSSKIKF